MRAPVVKCLVAALVAVSFPDRVAAQETPDFWAVAAGAAAEARRKPEIAAILLGGAMDYARRRDENGARPMLTQYQLMHAYVGVNQFETYKRVYGNPNFQIDVEKFDSGLSDHVNALRKLADDCDKRGQDKSLGLTDLQQASLGRCARDFIAIEAALRKKIAQNDAMGLADTLSLQGLYYSHFDLANNKEAIISAYQEALSLFDDARRERNALEAADREFSVGDRVASAEAGSSVREDHPGFYTGSSSEPYVPIVMMRAVMAFAEDAIEQGDAADAENFIALSSGAMQQAENLHKFMSRKWPCHLGIGLVHFWKGRLHATRLLYENKFKPGADAKKKQEELRAASGHFDKAIAVFKYQGLGSPRVQNFAATYLDMLRTNGRADQAAKVEQDLKEPLPAAIGDAGCPLAPEDLAAASLSQ